MANIIPEDYTHYRITLYVECGISFHKFENNCYYVWCRNKWVKTPSQSSEGLIPKYETCVI